MPRGERTERRLSVNLTQAQRRAVADLAPDLAARLKLGERQARSIGFTAAELEEVREAARAAAPHARDGMRRNSLRHVAEAADRTVANSQGIGAIPARERVFQLRIALLDTEPEVWRRIQVRDCTLDRLHERIQLAMGWTNSHLHHFRIGGVAYGDPLLLDENFEEFGYRDSTATKLGQILPVDGGRFAFEYEYDFGDCWRHEVLFEGCLRAEKGVRYPLCVEGGRACPPEDVGGTPGYRDYLEAIADLRHRRHEELLRWRGRFDPDAFDAARATGRMRRGLPDWRRMD